MNTETQITQLPAKIAAIATRLDKSVAMVIGAKNLAMFEKAYLVAQATKELQDALTPEYMAPIMALQGSKLGFRTDKDSSGGYPEAVVKQCLIEAVLSGFQPVGNHFNIIAGNMYGTKEGFGYALKNIEGLKWKVVPDLPRIKDQSAAAKMRVEWEYNAPKQTEEIDFAIRVNASMGADAVIGKATRKARAWLYSTVTGSEVGEGDVSDTIPTTAKPVEIDKEAERLDMMIREAATVAELEQLRPHVDKKPEMTDAYNARMVELSGKLV
jgi:hypothetical protein